jgi:hypothetical protein
MLKDGFLKISMHYIIMNSKTDVAKRELIRGPALEVLVPRSRGMPFDEALRIAEQGRRVIASNARISKALVGSEEWRSISDVFACWTGTMTAYAKPGEKLGATIEYVDPETEQKWVFPVPKQFVGMKDVILVAEHPDYTLEKDGKNLVVQAGAVDVVENFPVRNQVWYLADAKHGIPQGDEVSGNDGNARYLWRIDSRVGPARRGYYFDRLDDYGRRGVGLGDGPSGGFGVAVEAPEGGAEKTAPPASVEKAPEGKKVLIEVSGVSAGEMKTLLGRFAQDLGRLGDVAKDELLEAGRKLAEVLGAASLKE